MFFSISMSLCFYYGAFSKSSNVYGIIDIYLCILLSNTLSIKTLLMLMHSNAVVFMLLNLSVVI